MATPVDQGQGGSYPFPNADSDLPLPHRQHSSDEDGTLREVNDSPELLKVNTSYGGDGTGRDRSPYSPSAQRMESQRLNDDLEMLRAERVVSAASRVESGQDSNAIGRSRSRNAGEPVDDFDVGTTPIFEKTKIYQPPANPQTKFAKAIKKIHNSSFLIRYFVYIIPLTLVLLIPLLLGAFLFKDASVGGVELMWFMVWLEIVWLTLWAARILAKCIPWPMGLVASAFTNNGKKWRDLGKALEVPATIFFWWLAIEISFLPTMKNHHTDGNSTTKSWESTMNKVLISFFVGAILNFIEKIIIQLIAISFHLRTYADRIEVNKFQIASLTKLYIYSKEKIGMENSDFELKEEDGGNSGARTPMKYLKKTQGAAKTAITKVGDVAGKVAGDFTGKAVAISTHPHQVVLTLLGTTNGSQVLARRLYRTFAHEDSETVFSDDLRPAFDNNDEADAAFTMFDKDLNGDISMEELEAVCVEIGRERKAITASLKDLDSVVGKLDEVFLFVVFIVTLLVLISLISTSAAGVLTSLGSTVLALSWLLSATAQEFLQSCIFVFVKHPFDVGDRVHIYGNTGSSLTGDDYFVKEISLLFTEFKKMEGHVVQAPNSYLNGLFILNQRRSGGLAEAVPVTIKFGTTLEQIEALRARLLEFVTSEKREYQQNILTELTTITEAYSISLNVVFFYKSNWQNELLRLQRRNKFICALMVSMQELGIEGPYKRLPGARADAPFHLANPPSYQASTQDGQQPPSNQPDSGPGPISGSLAPHHSILRTRGRHASSVSEMRKHVDFSLGMSGISSGVDAHFGDVFEERKPKVPQSAQSPPPNSSDGQSLGRVTSRDSSQPRDSEDIGSRSRRGRFFGRRMRGIEDEGLSIDDLESGNSHAMADIPESGTATRRGSEDPAQVGMSGARESSNARSPYGSIRRAMTEKYGTR